MKTITITLNDGNEIVGEVIDEKDGSIFECIDENGLTFEVSIIVED